MSHSAYSSYLQLPHTMLTLSTDKKFYGKVYVESKSNAFRGVLTFKSFITFKIYLFYLPNPAYP